MQHTKSQGHWPSGSKEEDICGFNLIWSWSPSWSCAVILLPAHPASFAHKFLFQRVPGCNSIADFSLKKVFWTRKFAVGTH